MATSIVGAPSIVEKLQVFVSTLWKKLIEFLDSKGLKEPLERCFMQFKGLPLVKYIVQLFAGILSVIFRSQLVQKVLGQQAQGQYPRGSQPVIKRLPTLKWRLSKKLQTSDGWIKKLMKKIGLAKTPLQPTKMVSPPLNSPSLEEQTKYWKRRSA
eukprot:TRINITY_DN2660_c0_g1_i5.p2 TRINITY_DN2660_c0_g1~~TRINITY_DN2660_c0_g1_i5.p2  ORF type:complete len:155 (-),score=11.12 TRINITY_DN2660_c0_g1_i5:170-634(-)